MKAKSGLCLSLLLFSLLLSLPSSAEDAAAGLIGFWQDKDQPVVVEMKLVDDKVQGMVASNSDKPNTVGKHLFRDLIHDAGTGQWSGRIYVLKLGAEKNVVVVMQGKDQFLMTVKVGLLSKKVLWNRVESPAANSH